MKTKREQGKQREHIDPKQFQSNWSSFYKERYKYVGSLDVLTDIGLTCQARTLFQIINSLAFNEGYCFATNKTMAEKLGLKDTMVKKYLKELEDRMLIQTRYANTKLGVRRHIFIDFAGLKQRYFEIETEQEPKDSWVSKRAFNKKIS